MAQTTKPEAIILDAPATDVLVFRNGSKIIREGTVTVPGGDQQVALKFLPDSLDSSTVKVTGKGKVAGRIKSMNIENHYEQAGSKEEIEAQEKALETLREQEQVLARKLEFFLARKVDLVKLRETYLNQFPFALPEDRPVKFLLQATAGEFKIAPPKATIEAFTASVADSLGKATAKVFALSDELTALREKIDVLARQLDQMRNQSAVKTYKQVLIDVSASKEGEFTFVIEYVIYAGSWTPIYDVFLNDATDKVLIKLIAAVTNNSPEDWKEVSLTVSSADLRPVEVIEPQPWILREWMPAPQMQYASRRADRPVGGMAPPAPPAEEMLVPAAAVAEPSLVPVLQKPKAEIGGSSTSVITFKLPSRLTLTQGSWRNNIYLMEVELPGKAEFYYSTENAKLIIQNVIKNGDMQFLPGQAKIYVGEDFIGETSMNAVLPNEEFTLGTREAHELKIEKKLVDRSTDKGGLAKGKVVKYYSYEINVEILAETAKKNDLVLLDKYPYSESEFVKINLTSSLQPAPEENKLNVVKWRIKLADVDKKLKIAYQFEVSYEKGVILDTSLP
nr:mucoidy inhibitor MuiA family protein [Candidatus Sigynarchaeota archaeon]